MAATKKSQYKDITGEVFDRLTVLSDAGSNKHQSRIWICQCECGNTTTVTGTDLRKKNTRSCGCLSIETRSLPLGIAARNYQYKNYKYGAQRRGYSFELTMDQFEEIGKQDCHYCGGIPTAYGKHWKTATHYYVANGIDRVENTLGYVFNNCVPCCATCNIAKSTMTYHQYIAHCSKVTAHRSKFPRHILV